MDAPKITRIHVTVMLISADGRAIDRSITRDIEGGDVSPLCDVQAAAAEACDKVLDRLAGLDNRSEPR